jgi:hypothetical protein
MTEKHFPEGEFEDTPLEPFSAGYYGARMEVQAYDEGPVIEQTLFDYIESSLYQQTDAPPWVRIGMSDSPYFKLDGESGVPGDVLGLPERFIRQHEVLDNGHVHWLLLVKPGYAYMLSTSEQLSDYVDDSPFNL